MTAQVNGAGQVGTILRIKGENDIRFADWFVIDGVSPVNPALEPILNLAMIFMLTKPGRDQLEIHPPIVPDGPYRNVNHAPYDSATIRFYGGPGWLPCPHCKGEQA